MPGSGYGIFTFDNLPILIGQGVDYWGYESHSIPTLLHFRVNIQWLDAFATGHPPNFYKFHLYTRSIFNLLLIQVRTFRKYTKVSYLVFYLELLLTPYVAFYT